MKNETFCKLLLLKLKNQEQSKTPTFFADFFTYYKVDTCDKITIVKKNKQFGYAGKKWKKKWRKRRKEKG